MPEVMRSPCQVVNCEKSSAVWGTSSPRPPTGAPPLDPAGGLPSLRPPELVPSKFIFWIRPWLRLFSSGHLATITIPVAIDRESGFYKLKKITFMNFTEFLEKCPINFILKFSTLILTEELQLHFFTVTETLNQRHRIDRKKGYSTYTLTTWYWILLNLKIS